MTGNADAGNGETGKDDEPGFVALGDFKEGSGGRVSRFETGSATCGEGIVGTARSRKNDPMPRLSE
jgi:hypothetical protein